MSSKIINKYTHGEVNRAGTILIDPVQKPQDLLWAEDVLENWRGRHAYPINTFQSTLRDKLKKIDSDALVAQRLKRSPSIISKLLRFPKMQLARMQDIGGLRAIVNSIEKANQLHNNYKKSRFQHELVGEKNYIKYPKSSGYRGIHLIYKYHNLKHPDYDGLLLELQIRTKLQHIWATAVETAGTFLEKSLKSSEGPDEWLHFFAMTASAFATLEQSPAVPGYESIANSNIYQEVEKLAKNIGVVEKLSAFNVIAKHISADKKKGIYYLLLLNTETKTVSIHSYSQQRFDQANRDYSKYEKMNRDIYQVVLVSTSSIDALKKAYPSFFLDTHEFISKLKTIFKLSKK